MRTAIGLLTVSLLLLSSSAAADEVVLLDGSVVGGAVRSIEVEGRGTLTRADVSAVHLQGDRAALDAHWVERTLRFALERARREARADGKVGVYLGRGVFPPSGMAVVRRFDEKKKAPRLLFEEDLTTEGLAGLDVVVVPGGWAPSQRDGMGASGRAALTGFVREGGSYVGICAGAYLACESVIWDGVAYPYPLRLARGVARGPIPGLAPYPRSQVVKLTLERGQARSAVYAGGSSFEVEDATVLARYPNGSSAAVALRCGEGRVLLCGPHVELQEKTDADLLMPADWLSTLAPGNKPLLLDLLARLRKTR